MLDVRQLRYFLAVAQELHFGRAADRLHVAQSALSTQIARLEADLGVRLLSRAKRAAVALTDAGKRFEVEARAALNQFERADRIGRQLGRGEVGDLDVGYVASAALSGFLPTMLRAFRGAHPGVNVRLMPMETPRQIDAIVDGSIDIGFIRARPHYPIGISTRVVEQDALLLALPEDHPLASAETLHPADLLTEDFVTPDFHEAAGFAEYLATLGRLAGSPIEPAISVSDFITALSLADAGYGVVLVPASYANLSLGRLAYREIKGFDENVPLVAAWRGSDTAPTTLAIVNMLGRIGSPLQKQPLRPGS